MDTLQESAFVAYILLNSAELQKIWFISVTDSLTANLLKLIPGRDFG